MTCTYSLIFDLCIPCYREVCHRHADSSHTSQLLENKKNKTIRQDFKWKSHVNNICMKANKTTVFLCRLETLA